MPTIAISIADNQLPLAESLDTLGCSVYLGRLSEFSYSDFGKALDGLLEDANGLSTYSSKMLELVDGRGRERVVDYFESLDLARGA